MNKLSPNLIALFLVISMLVGCSTLQLESTWKDRDIELDGKGGDWLGAKYYFEDTAISLGLINDGQFLYVSMMTENPMIRTQIMRQGLTVWLDPKGKKSKTFGIKFPLGRQDDEQEGERFDPQDIMDETSREEMMQKFQASMTELEVLGPNEEVLAKMDIEDANGIEVKMRNAVGTFVYELKVPLAVSEEYPFAIGVKPGQALGVGLLAPKLEMRRPSGMRGGRGMGGRGGMGGSMGGRGGMGYGMGRMMPQELKIWAKVQLASAANPALTFFYSLVFV
jgi:hypothetical protein